MRRREFLGLVGGAAAWPLVARGQQPKVPVVGFLSGASPQAIPQRVAAFLRGLGETGYVEGKNVSIEYRWGADQLDRLPVLAAELVDQPVAVLVSHTDLAIAAARVTTTTIPIVFLTGADPVRAGFVFSLNRPRGNLTGVTTLNSDLGAKRMGLLHELLPKGTVIAVLADQNFQDAASQLTRIQEAARSLGRKIIVLNARTVSDIDAAFASLVQQRAGSLLMLGSNFFNTHREQIIALAVRHRIPAISDAREFAQDGGLLSYGNNLAESFRQLGIYTGRILKGEKPSNLPVVQPTKFELVINLKTAKALGIELPPGILAIADDVIE